VSTGTEVRLRYLASIRVSNVDKKSVEGQVPVQLCNYTDVYYNEVITGDLPFMKATATLEQIQEFTLRAGDVLITKDSETPNDIAVAARIDRSAAGVVCGYHLALLRPISERVASRYLLWSLISKTARSQFSAVATGITRFGLRTDAIGDVRLTVHELDRQQEIANFLDSETARINRLITKKQLMVRLLLERRSGLIELAIRDAVAAHGEAPLKFFAREVTVGIVVTPSAWYASQGVPALRGINVSPGHIDLNDLVYLTPEGHALHRKSELHPGDVVVVRTGQAGAAAVVPTELDGANCIDLLVVRPGPELDSKFLEYVLNSDWTQKHVERYAVGTIQAHFNVSAMKALPTPRVVLEAQRAIVHRLDQATSRLDLLVGRLRRQIGLLKEHREALITAAVTGQLEIPEAAT
jgi:type I restriction enzyme, S subunit